MRRINPAILQTVVMGGTPREYNGTPPTISPTLGTELVSNGGFASDTTGWTLQSSATLASVIGGQAGNALEITNGAASQGWCYQLATVVIGQYYFFTYYHKNGTSQGSVRLAITSGGAEYHAATNLNDAAWAQRVVSIRATTTDCYIRLLNASANLGNAGLWDTVSLKNISMASALRYLVTRILSDGNYQCTPTITANTQAGLAICYKDIDNLVLAYHDGTNAKLGKCIAGTWTSVISGAAAYGAGKALKVIVDGTDFSLYYDGTQVGATTAIADSLGTKVYGFSTYASNTLGVVSTSPLP